MPGARIDRQVDVADLEGRPADILALFRIDMVARAPAQQNNRHEDIGQMFVRQRDLDGRRAAVEGQHLLAHHPFALEGDQGAGTLEGRLDHHPGGLSRFVGGAVGHQLDAVVVLALPGDIALAGHIDIGFAPGRPSAGLAARSLEEIDPRLFRREAFALGGSSAGDGDGIDRRIHRLAQPFITAAAPGLAHRMPLTLDQPHLETLARGGRPFGGHRDQIKRQRFHRLGK